MYSTELSILLVDSISQETFPPPHFPLVMLASEVSWEFFFKTSRLLIFCEEEIFWGAGENEFGLAHDSCSLHLDTMANIFNSFQFQLYGEIGLEGDKARDFKKEFFFDHSYWSADARDPHFVTQDKVCTSISVKIFRLSFNNYQYSTVTEVETPPY